MPKSGIAGSRSRSIFSFVRNHHTRFHKDCTNLYSHQQWHSPFLHPCQYLLSFISILAILTKEKWDFKVVFICISLMVNGYTLSQSFYCCDKTPWPNETWRENDFLDYACKDLRIGIQNRTGSQRQKLIQMPQRSVAYLLAPHGLFGLLSYRPQDHQPRDGSTHNGLYPPLPITNLKKKCPPARYYRDNFFN